MLVCYAIQFRRYLLRQTSKRWTSVTATIQKGKVSTVPGGKGSLAFGSFFGYGFVLSGARYAGLFALIGNEEHAAALQDKLDGENMFVRYNPSNPNVSFLARYLRFPFRGSDSYPESPMAR